MSATATTLIFAIGLFRKQQSGVFLFKDYDSVTRLIAAKIIAGNY